MDDIDKKDKEDEKNEANKDKDGDEEEESHALFLKEKGTGIQILTQKEFNEQKNLTAPLPAVINATVVPASEEKEKEDKGKFERFLKATKQKQQNAKTLAESTANNDHQFQNKANEVPGSSQNWNGTKKDATTELTIVQDFHQVKAISNSTGSDDQKKEEKHSGGVFHFLSSMFKKVKSFFQMSW